VNWCWLFLSKHSLSIICGVIAIAVTIWGCWIVWPLEPDRWFDLLTSLGSDLGAVALFYSLAGRFREINKPEK
jgi:hypothetical protein